MENPEELEAASIHSNINCLPAVGIAEESREVAQWKTYLPLEKVFYRKENRKLYLYSATAK